MKKYGLITALNLMLFCLIATSAQAHMLWLTPDKPSPKPGETVTVTIGFGHHYPQGTMEKEGRLKRVYAVAPDGGEIDCQALSTSTYTFTPQQKGTYWLYAVMKPGFVSNTTKGRKLGNKETLENVVSCSAFRISAMTPVRCGDSKWRPAKGGAHELEVIPTGDPEAVDKGETIALKVLFQGKPLAGASVTPAASNAEHHHGHDQGHDHGQDAVETDADGIARIKLTSDESWLFTARHKTPYPDEELCDSFSYITSLTLDF